MKKTTMFLCIGISLCMHGKLSAQSTGDSLERLKDSIKMVTVTATRTTKDVMDVGRDVTVISPEQIKNSSCNTLAELLSQQAGIDIVGTGQNPGSIQSLYLRGADNNHTTIMIDGVPLTDPSTDGGELDLSELSLANVDKIEIVGGSHSTLYGSSAIGGVINIITKKNYTPGLHVSASVTGGEFGPQTSTFDESVSLNYTFTNGLYLTGGYHRQDVKGLNATVDTLTHPASYQMNPDRDNYAKSEPFAKLGYINKQWDIYFEYKNLMQTADNDASAFNDLKNASDHFVRDFYTWGAAYKLSQNFHLQYIGSYSHDYRAYVQGIDTVGVGETSSENDLFKASAMFHDIKAEYDYKTSSFILGGGYSNQSMGLVTTSYNSLFGTYTDNPDTVKYQQSTSDVYAQADINSGTFDSACKAYNLLLGVRYTHNSAYGGNISYEINPSVKVSKNSLLYLSYSTGFATPSLYELYSPNKYGDDPNTSATLGNPLLKAETSSSFELGVKHSVSSNLFFSLSWFRTVVDNHIDYVALWNSHKPVDSLGTFGDNLGYTYINLGQEITQGFQLNAAMKLSSKLSVTGNISLLSSTLSYNASKIDTAQTHNDRVQIYDGGVFVGQSAQSTGLLRRPGSLANFSITWRPINKLALTMRVRYVGASYDAQYSSSLGVNYYGAIAFVNVNDYTLVDAFASYEITRQFAATLRVENIFNTQYYEILGYNTLGRSIYINLKYAF